MRQPSFPIYIPSKGRPACVTARLFNKFGIPVRIVVEPQDYAAYAAKWGAEQVLQLPENNRGLVFARNFCKDHSIAQGDAKHWQFDDDISAFRKVQGGCRVMCHPALALTFAEDLTDQYHQVALTSFDLMQFVQCNITAAVQTPAFSVNRRCYTCFLVNHELKNRWRFRYNEDTDMTLQVLTAGWFTLLLHVFHVQAGPTNNGGTKVKKKGGQMSVYVNDGRLKMARELERVWPGVVKTKRRFGRPQHVINWRKFVRPLIRNENAPPLTCDFKLTFPNGEVRSPLLRAVVDKHLAGRDQTGSSERKSS